MSQNIIQQMRGRLLTAKRWVAMLQGKSVSHMRQQEGAYYVKGEVKGYYSDLRHKVHFVNLIDEVGVPYNQTNRGNFVYFPITIFQYGLGAYDLYLETGDASYRDKFLSVVRWATAHQAADGSWNVFGWQDPQYPASSMGQSEGASVLCRAFVETGDATFLDGAVRAVRSMLKPMEEGGCTRYEVGGGIILEECMTKRSILNGIIFSIWGLYEVCLLTKDAALTAALDKAVATLVEILPRYDRGYWSNYDLEGRIASPFYHDLHQEQLSVMYKLFGNEQFAQTKAKWARYQQSWLKGKFAFLVKAVQKLRTIDADIALIK